MEVNGMEKPKNKPWKVEVVGIPDVQECCQCSGNDTAGEMKFAGEMNVILWQHDQDF